MKLSKKICSEI